MTNNQSCHDELRFPLWNAEDRFVYAEIENFLSLQLIATCLKARSDYSDSAATSD